MNLRTATDRAEYVLWALGRTVTDRDRSCPSCGGSKTTLVKRKAVVTALHRCERCQLQYRIPKGDPIDLRRYYEKSYRQGIVTDVPSDQELEALLATGFKGSPRDFTVYLEVLKALPLAGDGKVLDYGSSWGYGSWQLASAGYEVFSYELSRSRAAFAAERLGCTVVDPSTMPGPVDCLFSAHVIEHLPQPRTIWQLAERILAPGGLVVLFLPNGEPARAESMPAAYHSAWGRVHPLMISAQSLRWMGREHGFTGRAYSSPYDLAAIAAGAEGDLTGDELLFVASRAHS